MIELHHRLLKFPLLRLLRLLVINDYCWCTIWSIDARRRKTITRFDWCEWWMIDIVLYIEITEVGTWSRKRRWRKDDSINLMILISMMIMMMDIIISYILKIDVSINCGLDKRFYKINVLMKMTYMFCVSSWRWHILCLWYVINLGWDS